MNTHANHATPDSGARERGLVPWITTREAAEALEVGHRTLIRWCRTGQIEAFRVGGRWRVPQAELERLLRATRKSA